MREPALKSSHVRRADGVFWVSYSAACPTGPAMVQGGCVKRLGRGGRAKSVKLKGVLRGVAL